MSDVARLGEAMVQELHRRLAIVERRRQDERSALQFPCFTCSAGAGEWCITRSGWWTPLHANRFYSWRRSKRLPAVREGCCR